MQKGGHGKHNWGGNDAADNNAEEAAAQVAEPPVPEAPAPEATVAPVEPEVEEKAARGYDEYLASLEEKRPAEDRSLNVREAIVDEKNFKIGRQLSDKDVEPLFHDVVKERAARSSTKAKVTKKAVSLDEFNASNPVVREERERSDDGFRGGRGGRGRGEFRGSDDGFRGGRGGRGGGRGEFRGRGRGGFRGGADGVSPADPTEGTGDAAAPTEFQGGRGGGRGRGFGGRGRGDYRGGRGDFRGRGDYRGGRGNRGGSGAGAVDISDQELFPSLGGK